MVENYFGILAAIMKILIYLALLVCARDGFANWVKVESSDQRFREYFYDADRVRKRGNVVYLWLRVRYHEATENGHWGSQAHYQINCAVYSMKASQITVYKDKNWEHISESFPNRESAKKISIDPMSPVKRLADFVCQN